MIVTQLCMTVQDLMDGSPPGSSIHGIFQARVLEWDAIAFSGKVLIRSFNLRQMSKSVKESLQEENS